MTSLHCTMITLRNCRMHYLKYGKPCLACLYNTNYLKRDAVVCGVQLEQLPSRTLSINIKPSKSNTVHRVYVR